jgi:outer membrane protein OmpA-like peptidoglycan-associated protein
VPREAIPRVLLLLLIASTAAAAGTPLKVDLDKARVDLAARKLEVRMNHTPGHVELKIYGASGSAPLLEHDQDLSGHAPGETITVNWPDPGGEVARLELRAYDAQGLWVGFALTPWWIPIPHEDVNFATDSATITPQEAPKLEASLKPIEEALTKYRAIGALKLFIGGHSDTVGNAVYNLKLSQRRAQAIAAWFRQRGLKIPILFEGFGEHAPRVVTPDQTDEPRNRWVDYILGVEEPSVKTTGPRPAWKAIR